MTNAISFRQIKDSVNAAKNILVICHQRPDADAVGSLAAVAGWFDDLGKTYTLFCRDAAPANLEWLTNFKTIVTKDEAFDINRYDLLLVLDSSDLHYAGVQELIESAKRRPRIINIDHHPTNKQFGDINLVDVRACSTTVILYELLQYFKIDFKPWMASAMLAGIIGDTYNFTNPNTDNRSLKVASDLLLVGASLPHVSDAILKNKELKTLQVWGKILSQMYYNYEYDTVIATVTEHELQGSLATEVNEGVANFLNNLSGIKAALILQQQPDGTVKGSLRTNDDLIDVSKLATMLGGGGHVKAAGFKIKGELIKDKYGIWQIV